MLAVDYPYSDNERGRDFLVNAPISAGDKDRLAHRNAEQLLRIGPSTD